MPLNRLFLLMIHVYKLLQKPINFPFLLRPELVEATFTGGSMLAKSMFHCITI